ncbi:hypothetical protein BDF14DRAFT_1483683 [Spinellus fusiger]|nr:hypothetical protein BDF14DRAFT_1483683 [Spinellus fusiger]
MTSPPSSVFDLSARFLEARRSRLIPVHHQTRPTNRRFKSAQETLDLFMERYAKGPPAYPSYLQDTVYAQLVEEQYRIYCEKKKEDTPMAHSHTTTSSYSHSKRGANLQRKSRPLTATQHSSKDTFSERLIDSELHLPTAWNPDDRG